MNLYYLRFLRTSKLHFIREERRIWKDFTLLLHITLWNNPALHFSLILRVFSFKYLLTVLNHPLVLTLFLDYRSIDLLFLLLWPLVPLTANQLSQLHHFGLQYLQFPLLLLQPQLIILKRFNLLIPHPWQCLYLLIALLVNLLQLSQLWSYDLPLSLSNILPSIRRTRLSFISNHIRHPRIVLIILLPEGLL